MVDDYKAEWPRDMIQIRFVGGVEKWGGLDDTVLRIEPHDEICDGKKVDAFWTHVVSRGESVTVGERAIVLDREAICAGAAACSRTVKAKDFDEVRVLGGATGFCGSERCRDYDIIGGKTGVIPLRTVGNGEGDNDGEKCVESVAGKLVGKQRRGQGGLAPTWLRAIWRV